MIQELFTEYDGAYADNTKRAYRADFQHYEQWCLDQNIDPFHATDETLSRYVSDLRGHVKPACISRKIHCLSCLFNLLDLPNPTKGKKVKLALKIIYRQEGRAQKQATPLRLDVLQCLQQACGSNLAGDRDRLLLQLGYETMRRRSELVSFRFEHVQSLSKNRHAIWLARSKTDQYGDGKLIPISNELYGMILTWGKRIKAKNGPILRSVSVHGQVGDSLSGDSVPRILKRLQRMANLDGLSPLSGHSFRVGAALDLLEEGVPIYQIMLRGGWSSETSALRYLKSWQPQAMPFFE